MNTLINPPPYNRDWITMPLDSDKNAHQLRTSDNNKFNRLPQNDTPPNKQPTTTIHWIYGTECKKTPKKFSACPLHLLLFLFTESTSSSIHLHHFSLSLLYCICVPPSINLIHNLLCFYRSRCGAFVIITLACYDVTPTSQVVNIQLLPEQLLAIILSDPMYRSVSVSF